MGKQRFFTFVLYGIILFNAAGVLKSEYYAFFILVFVNLCDSTSDLDC